MHETSLFFRAMNTNVTIMVAADPNRQAEVEASLREVESIFEYVSSSVSRFSPDSELTSLNRAAGRPFYASPLLFRIVARALAASRLTGGLFDPTILKALIQAGYDRTFESMHGVAESPEATDNPRSVYSWKDVHLDPETGAVLLPEGCGLDLGGIAKGWTVDQAVKRLSVFENFAVDAGGDLFVGGTQANESTWTVGVEDPFAYGKDLLALTLRDRAVATSTTARRRWRQEGHEQHHLLDPRTGRPSRSGVVAATVIANSVARAEVLAKTALLLGPKKGLQFLEGQWCAEGLLVLSSGSIWRTRNMWQEDHAA